MTRKELNAAVAVVKKALSAIRVMGMEASSFVTDDQLEGIVQDALQAAEDAEEGESVMAPRLAKSLVTLRDQANKLAPKRSKGNDGWIGDQAHANRKSDHNPVAGVVHAVDITHDPGHGLDSYKLAETLRINRDPRIKYVISAGKIFSPDIKSWQWRPYNGSNAHRQHVHVSVKAGRLLADDPRPWKLAGGPIVTAPPKTTPPTLWRGSDDSEAVSGLQELLGIEIDGDFGKQTEAAVKAFQKRKGLVVDGVVGINTWLALLSAE